MNRHSNTQILGACGLIASVLSMAAGAVGAVWPRVGMAMSGLAGVTMLIANLVLVFRKEELGTWTPKTALNALHGKMVVGKVYSYSTDVVSKYPRAVAGTVFRVPRSTYCLACSLPKPWTEVVCKACGWPERYMPGERHYFNEETGLWEILPPLRKDKG